MKIVRENLSKAYTQTYINQIKNKDINNICFMYLDSRTFRDKTKSFLISRWSIMNEYDIISDLLSINNGDIYNHPFSANRKYTTIYWISSYNCIDIVPIEIIKRLPTNSWNEQIVDTHWSNDITKDEVITIKEHLLKNRNTPKEVKEYLKTI